MMNDNELMHYGVLGMKWGVHRGRVAQSYGKAVAKRNKLDKRVEVAKAKAQKATVKANTGVSAKYKSYRPRLINTGVKLIRRNTVYSESEESG